MKSVYLQLIVVLLGISGSYGNFEKVFTKEHSVLDQPAGTGKILIQSELKIETLVRLLQLKIFILLYLFKDYAHFLFNYLICFKMFKY